MRKKFIILILVSVLMCVLIAFIISLVHSKMFPKRNTENISKNIKEQELNNDQIEISVENISLSDNYLILKYNLKSLDPEMDLRKISINEHGENQLRVDRRIKINDHTITKEFVYTTQIADVINSDEAYVYDIIDITGEVIPEEFNINIKFLENEFTSYFVEKMTEEEFEAFENFDTSLGEGQTEYVEPEIDYGLLQEDASPEDYYEVEGEYEWTEEISDTYEKTLDTKEGPALGEISSHIKKTEIQNNVKQVEYASQYNFDNLEILKGTIIETNDAKIIVFTSELSDLNYNKMYSKESGAPYVYRIDINDQDSNSLIKGQTHEVTITDSEGHVESEISKNSKDIKATIKNYILVNNSDGFIIRPYYYINYSEKEYIGEGI